MEVITVCSAIHTKHINTLCGQKVEYLNVKTGGTYSNDLSVKVNVVIECEKRWLYSLCLSVCLTICPHATTVLLLDGF
jgi:hypothetical protein